ncbi:MAG: efflux RND transporter periplasmic adaptor subunit [Chryseolinea sp.]
MKTKIIITCVITLLCLGVTFKLKSNKRTVEENVYRPDMNKKIMVGTDTVSSETFERALKYTGTFAALREVMIVPQVNGEVENVSFKEGDHVSKGAVLVRIDDDLLQAQYAAADASFENAKRNLERYERASVSGGVSKIQLDAYTLTLKTAESQRRQLSKQIGWSTLTAPFSGTVTLRDVEPGSIVGGSPVARITDLSQLKLEISVPEKEVVLFRDMQTAAVTTDVYPGHTFAGKVEYVSERADNAHNYLVRILIQNSSSSTALKAGMYGSVEISKDLTNDALIIPRTALVGSSKNPQVFVVENGKAILKAIHTGNTNDESIEVINGLSSGDVVVTSGHINLANGSQVAFMN